MPYIKQYWFLKVKSVKGGWQRSLPSGCAALVFHWGNRIYSSSHKGIQPLSYLSGQTLLHSDIKFSQDLNMMIVLFQPFGGRAFFRFPMYEIINRNIDTDLLHDPAITSLKSKLDETTDNAKIISLVEGYLSGKLCHTDFYNYNRMQRVLQRIYKGEGNISVLAQAACLSYKQFQRIFAEYAGLNPKDFLQIARFRKAFYSLRVNPRTDISRLAYDHGYYDKSHLTKEFKTLTGYAPKQLLALSDAYTEDLSLFHSFFIDGKKNYSSEIL